ncbi:hypothetical protein [Mucilaginibacter aquatilis]|uniref:PE-PGRS family protein n=1 Tax=Mucilaginibacter aquatilis TaxID=1517760 RepID=A0A6I4I3S6_9SPHI|nr:hypothetical protein [Mucilaginibacter aquatilis]MVN89701.1 hypothetical protein [Mucilaginibacter aquatilis]
MITRPRRWKFLWPVLILALELAAYAQNRKDDKNYVAGKLKSELNNETSGIAASSKHQNIFYIHNDSGDEGRFFAISPDGALMGIFKYSADDAPGYGVRDCEDIAVGPGPDSTKSYVYVGDIGDNGENYPNINIYRAEEPDLYSKADSTVRVKHANLTLKYPDGPHDAETLMIDPLEKLLYIVTKRHKSVSVYTAPLLFNNNDTVTLTKRADLHFRGLQPFKWIVSGDISKDAKQVVLKSYSRIYYWKREGNEPIWQTLQRKPQQPAYEQERLGEAIGFAANGRSYYTVSEGMKQPIFHYAVPKK